MQLRDHRRPFTDGPPPFYRARPCIAPRKHTRDIRFEQQRATPVPCSKNLCEPARTNPLTPNSTPQARNQLGRGVAPMNKKTLRIAHLVSTPVGAWRQRTRAPILSMDLLIWELLTSIFSVLIHHREKQPTARRPRFANRFPAGCW